MSKSINLAAELDVVAAIMGGAAKQISIFCRPEDCYDLHTRNIVWAARELLSEDLEVSGVAVCDLLKRSGRYDPDIDVYLENAINQQVKDPEGSARLVVELATRRRLSDLLSTQSAALINGEISSTEAINIVSKNLFSISIPTSKEAKPISDIATDQLLYFGKLIAGEITGYSTFIPSIDNLIGGVQKSELIGIVGPPAGCKSLWILKILLNHAIKGITGALYTLEMPVGQVFNRAVAMMATKLDNALQLRGTMTPGVPPLNKDQYHEILEVAGRLKSLGKKLFMADNKHDLGSILSDAMRRVEYDGAELIAVDYAQKVQMGEGSNRADKLARISSDLRNFALKYNIPVFGVLKMNRAGVSTALKGDDVVGDEIDGSSAFEYDCSTVFNIMVKKPELLCDCSSQVLDEYKRTHKGHSKHKTNENITCYDCNGLIRKAANRYGRITITKARDGEMDNYVPIILHGAKLKLGERTI